MGVRSKSHAKPLRQHAFPLRSGILRGAPPTMTGFSNTRIPHQVRLCHQGARLVLRRRRRQDHRSFLVEALKLAS